MPLLFRSGSSKNAPATGNAGILPALRSTGFQPVSEHGQGAHATQTHGLEARATAGILPAGLGVWAARCAVCRLEAGAPSRWRVIAHAIAFAAIENSDEPNNPQLKSRMLPNSGSTSRRYVRTIMPSVRPASQSQMQRAFSSSVPAPPIWCATRRGRIFIFRARSGCA